MNKDLHSHANYVWTLSLILKDHKLRAFKNKQLTIVQLFFHCKAPCKQCVLIRYSDLHAPVLPCIVALCWHKRGEGDTLKPENKRPSI